MKTLIVIPAAIIVLVGTALSQYEGTPNRSTYTEDATVLPHLSVLVHATAGVVTTGPDAYRANARLGLADAFEFGFDIREQSIDFLGTPQLRPTVSLKVRLLEGTETRPAAALMYRTEFGWNRQTLRYDDLQLKRPSYVAAGLEGGWFEGSTSVFELILTHRLASGPLLTLAGGIQEFRYRNVWIFKESVHPGFVARGTKQRLIAEWYAQALIPVAQSLAVVAETRSVPGTSPMLDSPALRFDRLYHLSAGIRYTRTELVAVDVKLLHTTAIAGLSSTEVRVGACVFIRVLDLMQ